MSLLDNLDRLVGVADSIRSHYARILREQYRYQRTADQSAGVDAPPF